MDESFSDFQFPVHGIDRTRSNQEQPAGSTILGQNCRAFEASTLRGRGGSRPGILPYVNDVLPGEVQNLTSVVTVDGTALLANYDDTPPDLYDPSSVGPVDAWPPGRFTRSPALGLPEWGWGIPPWKNAPETVNIVWPSAGTIGLGTALGGSQLNATAKDRISGDAVSGTFTYSPASGTQLPLGNAQELLTRFVPDDLTRYGVTYGFNEVNVIQSDDEIVYVQSAGNTDASPLAFDDDIGSGSLLIVAVCVDDEDLPTVLSVTDSQGTSYTLAATITLDEEFQDNIVYIYYGISNSAGSNTVTVGFSDPGNALLIIAEYSGTATSSVLGGTSTNTGTTDESPMTTGSVSVSDLGSVVIAAFMHYDVSVAAGDYTIRETVSDFFSLIDHIGVDSSEAATMTSSNPSDETFYVAVGASFKKGS